MENKTGLPTKEEYQTQEFLWENLDSTVLIIMDSIYKSYSSDLLDAPIYTCFTDNFETALKSFGDETEIALRIKYDIEYWLDSTYLDGIDGRDVFLGFRERLLQRFTEEQAPLVMDFFKKVIDVWSILRQLEG